MALLVAGAVAAFIAIDDGFSRNVITAGCLTGGLIVVGLRSGWNSKPTVDGNWIPAYILILVGAGSLAFSGQDFGGRWFAGILAAAAAVMLVLAVLRSVNGKATRGRRGRGKLE